MHATTKVRLSLPLCLLLAACSGDNNPTQATSGSENSADNDPNQPTEVLRIAAAANLAGVLPAVVDAYQQSALQNATNANTDSEKQHAAPKIEVTYASSGKLYAQIHSGAPYDIFLSADQGYPAKYQPQTAANPQNAPFTYARGQLALYSSNQDLSEVKALDPTKLQQLFNLDSKSQPITGGKAVKITIANPELAPYGASAKAFLQQQGLYSSLNQHNLLIQAENIGQAFQYAHTATTDYSFVALSQLISANVAPSKYLTLKPDSYPAILQDGIILSDHPQAIDFSHYLQSEPAQQIFAEAGYLAVSD